MIKNRGFAYIALLAVLTVIVLALGKASEDIAHSAAREREVQLLFVGKQYLHAIESYYENSPQDNKQYPRKLTELLADNRFLKPARHLRRLYADPVTGSTEWGLVRNEQGLIMGVFSLSDKMPIKTRFDYELQQSFGNEPLLKYSNWKFVYRPALGGSAPLVETGSGLAESAPSPDSVSVLSDE